MRRYVLMVVLLLNVFFVIGQEFKESYPKGVFEVVSVKTLEVGQTQSFYKVDAATISKEWKSDDFKYENGFYATGAYSSNVALRAESNALQLPKISEQEHLYARIKSQYSTERNYDFVRIAVSVDGGKTYRNICRRSGVTSLYDEYVDLTPFAGKSVNLAFSLTSNDSYNGDGWKIAEVSLEKEVKKENVGLRSSNVDLSSTIADIKILGYSPLGYPKKMHVYFSAKNAQGKFVENLGLSDINVKVDGKDLSNSCMQMTRLTSSSNLPVDIVFLMDNSGSMEDDIEGVKEHVSDLVRLIGSNMEARAGFVQLGYDGDCPIREYSFQGGVLTSIISRDKQNEFSETFGDKNQATGGYEPYYGVLRKMVDEQNLNYKSNSQKVLILIGDESALYEFGSVGLGQNADDCLRGVQYDNKDKYPLIRDLQSKGFQVFTIVDHNLKTGEKPDTCFVGIAEKTGGISIDIKNNSGYYEIFNKIAQALTERYVLTIDMSCGEVPIQDCHNVSIGSTNSSANANLCVNEQPTIVRTPSTILYDTKPVMVESKKERIGVKIFDSENNEIKNAQVTVYIKNINDDKYNEPVDAEYDGDGYYYNVPSKMLTENAVLCYYFRANLGDDKYILSSPEGTEPYEYWTMTVLPNRPPVFGERASLIKGEVCQKSNLCVEVKDEDENLKTVWFHYKKKNEIGGYFTEQIAAKSNNGEYCVEIPASFAVAPGIDYYVRAEDSYGSLGLKGSEEYPLTIEIDDEIQESGKKQEITLQGRKNQYSDCAAFRKGDEIFVYYENGCDDSYLSLAGYMKLENDNETAIIKKFPVLGNSGSHSYKDGLSAGDYVDVKLLRNGVWFDLSNRSTIYKPYGILSVSAPFSVSYVLKGNWIEIHNGDNFVSSRNNTDFGYTTDAKTNEFLIENYAGCGELTITKIEFSSPEHFSLTKSLEKVGNWSSGTFEITYDGKADAESYVTIQSNAGEFKFRVQGKTTENLVSCEGIQLSLPLTESKHTISIETTIPSGYLRVYAVNTLGQTVHTIYNGLIHAGTHELDLWPLMSFKNSDRYYIVVEREGYPTCSNMIYVNN